ncbi:ACP phosphodiesterase [Oceanicoccus sagamiensis]|uniref:ACP phosphodiesterase n=1 Tax=Oceanicoccus sagamiensis TaxID=716816 RepID=A0A1X9NI38_9GAMM|nr:ACP phosphodiesterase [Oceanicoccus sagamiensis]ARN73653.1 hypothetical protein BST96_05680 [Oceanicoccus sagamiensis]
MNYLAHFHLSHGSDDLLIGALLGDFIKGPLKGERKPSIEQGIFLHRKIDAYTDSHPLLKQAHQLFSPHYRRYAGIMTDVAFDHFLNQHWQQFHPDSLRLFSQQVFQLITSSDQLTPPAKRQAENLARYDVFEHYQHWETVEAALERISQRLLRDNPLASGAREMQGHYSTLEDIFLQFYPELQQHTRELRKAFR